MKRTASLPYFYYIPHCSSIILNRFTTIRAHFAFRNLCFAGCGNSCSSVIGRAFPHPDPGAAAPIPPLLVRFRLVICLTGFSEGRFFRTSRSGVYASHGAGTAVHLLSEEPSRTRIPRSQLLPPASQLPTPISHILNPES